jgi:hypothetical protein
LKKRVVAAAWPSRDGAFVPYLCLPIFRASRASS